MNSHLLALTVVPPRRTITPNTARRHHRIELVTLSSESFLTCAVLVAVFGSLTMRLYRRGR